MPSQCTTARPGVHDPVPWYSARSVPSIDGVRRRTEYAGTDTQRHHLARRHRQEDMMNRVALITGASRGLGKTLAPLSWPVQGYDLILDARGQGDLDSTAAELRGHGGHVIAVAGDVSEPGHRHTLLAAAEGLAGWTCW